MDSVQSVTLLPTISEQLIVCVPTFVGFVPRGFQARQQWHVSNQRTVPDVKPVNCSRCQTSELFQMSDDGPHWQSASFSAFSSFFLLLRC